MPDNTVIQTEVRVAPLIRQ